MSNRIRQESCRPWAWLIFDVRQRMTIIAYILLLLAAIAVREGYLAMMGPIAPGVTVWWTGMLGPFVACAATLAIVRAISRRPSSGVVLAGHIYALVVSSIGLLLGAIMYAGRNASGQNHSEFALFFVPLWAVSLLASPMLVIIAVVRRLCPKKPNKAPEPTPMSVTPPAAQESRRP